MRYDDEPARLAIDPVGCGCTECLIGEYVPLECATADDVTALLTGQIADHSESTWFVSSEPAGRLRVFNATTGAVWVIDAPAQVMLHENGTAMRNSAADLVAGWRTQRP